MTKKKEDAVIAFKGLDKNFQCRGFQYEVGKTYEHDGRVSICESGFHACESPFDVWSYYGPAESRFAAVSVTGEVERHSEDSKIASARITIDAELTLPQFIKSGIDWLLALTKNVKDGSSGNYAKIGSSGNYAQIGNSGNYAKIGSSGNSAKIGSSGYYAQIGSSGYYAQIGSSGNYAKIGSSGEAAQIGSSGDYAKIGSSGDSAQIGSSGNYAQIGSGNYAQIGSSGYSAQIEATGKDSVIASAGGIYKFKLGEDGCIAVRYHDGKRNRFVVGYVGENLRADVWYQVTDAGEFSEVE